MTLEILSTATTFGGTVQYCRHQATTTKCPMRFSVFTPPQAAHGKVPLLWWLSGLTCTEDNFTVKAGAYRKAAELGLMIIAPDTSPRGDGVPNDDAYDFGQGAGFYVDATQAPWAEHFQMYSYITDELPKLIFGNFPADASRQGIFGHSMGGHGALTLALRHRDIFKSVSAFAPIAAPIKCAWGRQAFSRYLGNDETRWTQHDASALMSASHTPYPAGILVDQGLADKFLAEQLLADEFEAACKIAHQPLTLEHHAAYDHGYYFISTLMEKHIAFHAAQLNHS